MPRFEVRLESPDLVMGNGDPHYRVTRLTAKDEAEARRVCETLEARRTAYQMPEEEHAAAEAREKAGEATSQDRGRLSTHRQATAYVIVSVERLGKRG